MDSFFDGAIQFAMWGIKIVGVQLLMLLALRFMSRCERTQVKYDVALADDQRALAGPGIVLDDHMVGADDRRPSYRGELSMTEATLTELGRIATCLGRLRGTAKCTASTLQIIAKMVGRSSARETIHDELMKLANELNAAAAYEGGPEWPDLPWTNDKPEKVICK